MKPVAGECLKGKIYKLEYGREGFLINLGIWSKKINMIRTKACVKALTINQFGQLFESAKTVIFSALMDLF